MSAGCDSGHVGDADGLDSDRVVAVADVEAVRSLMASRDLDDRHRAVEMLEAWQGAELTPDGARAALAAAGTDYPWVPGAPADTSELFVRLTFTRPALLDPEEFERAYMLCAERGRRAVLRALALRADRPGLEAVLHLLGPDGPLDLLPAPGDGLLTPLLDVPGVELLAPRLVAAVARRGWTDHAVQMIVSILARGALSTSEAAAIATALAPTVSELADTCDRLGAARSVGNAPRGDGSFTDPARVDRRRLMAMLPLFAMLPGPHSSALLRRALSCADPRAGAGAAVALISRGERVGADRLEVLCKDPQARAVLFDGLVDTGRECLLPGHALRREAVAESQLVTWLASPTQLRCAPDEVEHRGVVPAHPGWARGPVHVLAFRMNAPHWAGERGWMIGVVGPFDPDAVLTPRRAAGFAVGSLYEPESAMTAPEHLMEITRSLWMDPGEPIV